MEGGQQREGRAPARREVGGEEGRGGRGGRQVGEWGRLLRDDANASSNLGSSRAVSGHLGRGTSRASSCATTPTCSRSHLRRH